MSVKIRLRRQGRTHLAYFQLVAADARSPRDGKFLEKLGTYDPNTNPAKVYVNHEAALKWLRNGAQPTDTAKNLLQHEGIMLKLHLERKGKSAEEIEQAYTNWLTQKQAKLQSKMASIEGKRREQEEAQLQAERDRLNAVLSAKEEARKAAEAEAKAAQEAAAAEAATAEGEGAEEAPAEGEAEETPAQEG